MAYGPRKIGLVIRSAPFTGRSGRDQLDLVMAAMLNDLDVELFFSGQGLLHLLGKKETNAARLGPSWKGWKSLAELGELVVWADESGASILQGHDTLLDARVLEASRFAAHLKTCDKVLVI